MATNTNKLANDGNFQYGADPRVDEEVFRKSSAARGSIPTYM